MAAGLPDEPATTNLRALARRGGRRLLPWRRSGRDRGRDRRCPNQIHPPDGEPRARGRAEHRLSAPRCRVGDLRRCRRRAAPRLPGRAHRAGASGRSTRLRRLRLRALRSRDGRAGASPAGNHGPARRAMDARRGAPISRRLWLAVGGYAEATPFRSGNEDWDFWIPKPAAARHFKPARVARPLYRYRQLADSMSRRLHANDFVTRQAILDRHPEFFDRASATAFLGAGCWRTSHANAITGRVWRTIAMATRAQRLSPWPGWWRNHVSLALWSSARAGAEQVPGARAVSRVYLLAGCSTHAAAIGLARPFCRAAGSLGARLRHRGLARGIPVFPLGRDGGRRPGSCCDLRSSPVATAARDFRSGAAPGGARRAFWRRRGHMVARPLVAGPSVGPLRPGIPGRLHCRPSRRGGAGREF